MHISTEYGIPPQIMWFFATRMFIGTIQSKIPTLLGSASGPDSELALFSFICPGTPFSRRLLATLAMSCSLSNVIRESLSSSHVQFNKEVQCLFPKVYHSSLQFLVMRGITRIESSRRGKGDP